MNSTPSPRHHLKRIAKLLFLALPLLSGLLNQGVAASELPVELVLPFKPGERFVYDLRWGLIPAGQAELKVMPMEEVAGVPAWHFQLIIRSNDFIDVFYKVRDRIDAYATLSLEESLLYRQSQQEGTTRREVEVSFDRERSQAIFTNFGESLPPIDIMPGTLDPLTALFFIRSQPLAENLEIVRPISDGKRNVKGVARVNGREEVSLNGNVYDAFQIDPDLKGVKGVFEKSNKSRMTLWVTADRRRMLVKIKSKVVIGSFTGTLVENS